MTRISTANTYASVLSDLMLAQTRMAEAGKQVSSQKNGDDLKSFARDADTLTAAKSVKTRVDGFIEQAKSLNQKLESQDLALNRVADAAQTARQAIADALASNRAEALIESMESAFGEAIEGLNSQHQGRFLFSGAQVGSKPVTAGQLSDLTTAATVADLFANDDLASVSRLDEATAIETGFLADAVGTDLFEAFKSFQAFQESAQGPFDGELTDAQKTFLQSQLATFDTARSDLTAVVGRNGLNQNRVDRALDTQTSRQIMLEGVIGDVVDADLAKASTLLSQAETSLKASAQVFNVLSGSSLLNLLQT